MLWVRNLVTLAHIRTAYVPLLLDLKTLGVSLDYDCSGALVANFVVRPALVDQIRGKQMQDDELVKEVHKIMKKDIGENFWITQDGMLVMKGMVVCLMLMIWERLLWNKPIVRLMQCTRVVPRSTEPLKKTIGGQIWKKTAEFVSKRLLCQQMKAKHSEICRNSSAFAYTKIEVGTHYHGLLFRFASYSDWSKCQFGDCG